MASSPLFGSMLLGGFECSAHQLASRRRLDILASTGHDLRAADDYRLLQQHGIGAARDGLRWHLIESRPGRYDWSSFVPMLRAARDTGITVIWDLLHYGVPPGVDVFSPRFITRFAAFAREAAKVIASETDTPPLITPINEISYWAFAGGDTGHLNPFAQQRGGALKRQLVRAALAAAGEMRTIDARARILIAEPLIHIHPANDSPDGIASAARHNNAQFEALDLLLGRAEPELGGHEGAVDIIGLNFYFNNIWIDHQTTLFLGDVRHTPLHQLLHSVASRYSQPLYIAETGTEGVFRPYWLRYICDQVREAAAQGTSIGGICLYPIISHLGWDDDRRCPNGLFEGFAPDAIRHPYPPLAQEVRAQADAFRTQMR